MNEILARRVAGASGIAAAAALILEVPLYFVYSGPPPDANVLARLLIGIFAFGFLIVFLTAFRELVRKASPENEWVSTLAFASGLLYTTVTLVSSGLEAGAVIASDKSIDPTITVNGTYILYGTIGRMLLAMMLASIGYATVRAGLLPRWTSRTAFTLAGISLAFMPSLFFGNEPSHFYAANGWGTTATMGAVFSYWLLAFGISTFRSAKGRAERGAPLPATHPAGMPTH